MRANVANVRTTWYTLVMANTLNNLVSHDDEVTICALPGCEEPVRQPPGGGPRRLYCSDAHRSAAARLRRNARAAEESVPMLSIATGDLSALGTQLANVVGQRA